MTRDLTGPPTFEALSEAWQTIQAEGVKAICDISPGELKRLIHRQGHAVTPAEVRLAAAVLMLRAEVAEQAAALESSHAGESAALDELARLRQTCRDLGEDEWVWLGDGTDNLASMSDGMNVHIRAGELQRMLDYEREMGRLEGIAEERKPESVMEGR